MVLSGRFLGNLDLIFAALIAILQFPQGSAGQTTLTGALGAHFASRENHVSAACSDAVVNAVPFDENDFANSNCRCPDWKGTVGLDEACKEHDYLGAYFSPEEMMGKGCICELDDPETEDLKRLLLALGMPPQRLQVYDKCDWPGVTCSKAGDRTLRVSRIELAGMPFLNGTFPIPDFGLSFSYVAVFDVARTAISGPIERVYKAFPYVSYLDLSMTRMDGFYDHLLATAPTELRSLKVRGANVTGVLLQLRGLAELDIRNTGVLATDCENYRDGQYICASAIGRDAKKNISPSRRRICMLWGRG